MADDTDPTGRTTAPQSPYTFAAVRIGILVFLIGSLLAFGLPYVLG